VLDRKQKLLVLTAGVIVGAGIAAAVVALAISDGGGESPSAVRPSRTPVVALPDPCQLITREDALQVFGKVAIESGSAPVENARDCSYRETSGASGANDPALGCPLGLGVQVWADSARDLAKNEKISGLGDEAYWVSKTGTPSLWARRGEIRISVGLAYDPMCDGETIDYLAEKARETVQAQAATSLSRLP
jgi:hypothetical protein